MDWTSVNRISLLLRGRHLLGSNPANNILIPTYKSSLPNPRTDPNSKLRYINKARGLNTSPSPAQDSKVKSNFIHRHEAA